MGLWSILFGGVLPVGVEIVFLGQPRRFGLMTGINTNEEGYSALQVKYVGLKKNELTGYWFQNHDFSPSLDTLDIKSYGGLVVCYKSVEGKNNFLPPQLLQKNEMIAKTRKMLDIYKRSNLDLLNVLENKKITDSREIQTIQNAKQLKLIKDIVEHREIFSTKKEAPSMSSMFSR